jgi:pyruvate/2-oxoglutarate dehydrogenase complex dihydrolipoamide dehydrogenase (E3) component
MGLYDLRDSLKIKQKSTGKNVVIMGSGFIGMELLGPLNIIAKSVTVVQRSSRPYGIVLGETVGRLVQSTCERRYKKVSFVSCDEIKQAIGNDMNEVTKVVTLKKREIDCDLLIFAIGGVPNTEFLQPFEFLGGKENISKIPPEMALGMLNTGYIPVTEVC